MVSKTPKQLLQDLEKGITYPVYYLYGDEPYKIEEFIQKIKSILNYDTTRLDGSEIKGIDVLESMQTIGLFTQTSNKLIIVRRAQDLKEVEPLFSELQSSFTTKTSNSSNVLILIAESLDLRKKFHQWLKKEGYAIEFKADKGSQLTPWIQYIAKKKGLELSDDAFPFLALICEGSLHHLSQELEKAALYVGINSETTITKETIARVCSGSASFSLSELVAYVLNSDKYKALLLVQKLIREPDEALGFLGLLTWYLKRQTATIPLAFILDLIELDEKLKSTGLPAKLLIEQFVSNLLENSPLLQNHENV